MMHYTYLCIIVFRKVHIGILWWICCYFIVVVGLPLHQHVKDTDIEHCEHHSKDKHEQDQKEHTHEDCIICYNLHVAHAIVDFDPIELTVARQTIASLIISMKPLFWDNITLFNSANKDPPLSIIS